VVYGRHGIGRYEPDARLVKAPLKVTMPSMPCQGLTFNAPNVVEHTFKGPSNDSRPGPYVPFDYDIVDFLRDSVPGWETEKATDLAVHKPRARFLATQAQRHEQEAYQRADVDDYVGRKLMSVSDVDAKEWALYRHLRERKRRVMA
jgi:hypothetical protein